MDSNKEHEESIAPVLQPPKEKKLKQSKSICYLLLLQTNNCHCCCYRQTSTIIN